MFKLKISNWKSAILETLLIVIGISIAFGLESWNQKRLLRTEEVELLTEFNKTLDTDLADIRFNVSLYSSLINSANQILKAFDQDLPFHDSMVFHFSALTYNMLFYRNDGPYEVLKSRGFDLISDDSLRYMLTDLYSAEYRIIDNVESYTPQTQSYPHLFDYIKKHFRKSDLENFNSDWLVSIEPLDYEWIKTDPHFRLLVEHTAFWKDKTIIMYERTRRKLEAVQRKIRSEIDRLS